MIPNDLPASARSGADLLRRLVDLVSHRTGATLSLMGEAGVTLPQVLLLNRVATLDRASISELAEQSPGTRAAVGQMVDRLVRQGLLHRLEDSDDRRRRSVSVSAAGAAFLRELEQARTAEYAIGLARIDPALRAELERLLQRVVAEIEHTPVGADQ